MKTIYEILYPFGGKAVEVENEFATQFPYTEVEPDQNRDLMLQFFDFKIQSWRPVEYMANDDKVTALEAFYQKATDDVTGLTIQNEDIKKQLTSANETIQATNTAVSVTVQNSELNDEDALKVKEFYPEWIVDKSYKSTEIVRFEENLYRVAQDHTSQDDWRPDTTASLYSLIKLGSDGIEEWHAPTGGHDAYEKGSIVRHNEKIWESMFDGKNVWEPGSDETLWKEKND